MIKKSLIALLPKKDGALDVADFRPINLVRGAIKIFEKVLACRLVWQLPKLVGNHQIAFVKGSSLHDNFMLVQSTARRLNALHNPTVLLKLDISKAFDSVQWSFLSEVMQQLGFGSRWRSWICGILATSTTKIMVNGDPGDTIYNCKGLRQGDPISPVLFILTMEPLQRLFERAMQRGLLEPLASRGMRQRFSIFMDDVVVFIKPKPGELEAAKRIFEVFGEASGMRINMEKSAALLIRCTDQEINMASGVLGCPRGSFPITWACRWHYGSSFRHNCNTWWIKWRIVSLSGRRL